MGMQSSYIYAFHCIGIKLLLLLEIACVHTYVRMCATSFFSHRQNQLIGKFNFIYNWMYHEILQIHLAHITYIIRNKDTTRYIKIMWNLTMYHP